MVLLRRCRLLDRLGWVVLLAGTGAVFPDIREVARPCLMGLLGWVRPVARQLLTVGFSRSKCSRADTWVPDTWVLSLEGRRVGLHVIGLAVLAVVLCLRLCLEACRVGPRCFPVVLRIGCHRAALRRRSVGLAVLVAQCRCPVVEWLGFLR